MSSHPYTPHRALRHWTARLLLAVLCILLNPAVQAATALEGYAGQLDVIERALTRADFTEDQLKDWSERLDRDRSLVADCISTGQLTLERLRADLEGLGEAVQGEAAEVTRKRREVRSTVADQERQLAECRVMLLRGDELGQRVVALHKTALAERLFAKGPSLLSLLLDNWHNTLILVTTTASFVQQHAGFENLSPLHWLWFSLVVGAVAAAGFALRARQRARLRERLSAPDAPVNVGVSLLLAGLHYAPRLFASLSAALFIYMLTYEIRPVPFINVLLYGLPVYLSGLLIVHLLFWPRPPCRPLLAIDETYARKMARRLQVLALLAYVGYLLFSTLLAQHLGEEAYLLARGLYAGLLFLNLIWALWLFARLRQQDELRWVGLLMALVLIVSLGAEWLGYRNLALNLVRVIAGSILAFGLLLLMMRLFHEFYDALEQGEGRWARQLRLRLGVLPGNALPGMLWFRLTTNLLLWSLFGYAMLRIWQVSTATVEHVEGILIRGFPLGSFQIVPYRILLAIATFALLVTLARWLQTRIERDWLRYARMDHGAREAMVTITGYVMVTMAAVFGLGVAGFEFGNLAIIAGALSVGIGFGLQNIVNNFVSGLILLFERPVKTGDWIVVGSTEGYVKRISIRSTQIQTFDHADVIVPNSELISQQVTNWMLYDTQGRARVPVGVAYGSDTQKVKTVLEKVAREHPKVITNGTYPDPKVLFLGFGDSALNFELRCFVRSIDERLSVVSDLNFAIDAAFRAEGIEIPFPQRDLHVRSLPPGYPPAADGPAPEPR
ncbi:MAG: mechanosensitive ion channel domain-containing protein [Gammaproteobacteria bacterium]